MIVRIMGEGQWDIGADVLPTLNEVDDVIGRAVRSGDQATLTAALGKLDQQIRAKGRPLPEDALLDSDLIVPNPDATLAEVAGWLQAAETDEGLIPDNDVTVE